MSFMDWYGSTRNPGFHNKSGFGRQLVMEQCFKLLSITNLNKYSIQTAGWMSLNDLIVFSYGI